MSYFSKNIKNSGLISEKRESGVKPIIPGFSMIKIVQLTTKKNLFKEFQTELIISEKL